MATQFDKFKLWIFPGLVSVLGLVIWSIVSEIRSDMKFLMTQYSADHIRIDNLERVVYGKSLAAANNKSNKIPFNGKNQFLEQGLLEVLEQINSYSAKMNDTTQRLTESLQSFKYELENKLLKVLCSS